MSLKYETRQGERSHARQLERVLDLLEFHAERGEARAGEITEALAAPRASVHRLLAVLQERGYIERVNVETPRLVYRSPTSRNSPRAGSAEVLSPTCHPRVASLSQACASSAGGRSSLRRAGRARGKLFPHAKRTVTGDASVDWQRAARSQKRHPT